MVASVFSTIVFSVEPIKLGASGPYTGGSSPMGISMRNGMRLAVSEINAKGGVLGRPLELVERDDEAKNERGVQIAQELLFKEKIVAGVGIINTGVGMSSARFYQEAKIPLITPGPSGTSLTKLYAAAPANYIFRVSLPDAVQAEMIATEAIDKRKYRKVAIIADSSNYGQLGREDMVAALAKRGVKPVAVEKYNVGDVDMTPQLLRAKSADADVILTYGVGPDLAQIVNGMPKLGFKIPVIGSWTLSMPNFIENAGANAEGIRMPQTFIVDASQPKREEFADKYDKAYSAKRIPGPVWAAQGYDVIYIIAAAIHQAGTTDGEKVRTALEGLNAPVDGVIRIYQKPFSKDNHEAFKSPADAVMGQIDKGIVRAAN
ncbi:ABC transporter substrate-binding protein [Paraburkholderia sp. 22B1P]|uniref:ABC transporter substrate-binding protein n=1 Tax=Paraburkholderia sp. 22B1P TaxID=3080498 RepID=UPI0030CEC99B